MIHFGNFEDWRCSKMEDFFGDFDSDTDLFFEKFDQKGIK